MFTVKNPEDLKQIFDQRSASRVDLDSLVAVYRRNCDPTNRRDFLGAIFLVLESQKENSFSLDWIISTVGTPDCVNGDSRIGYYDMYYLVDNENVICAEVRCQEFCVWSSCTRSELERLQAHVSLPSWDQFCPSVSSSAVRHGRTCRQ